MIEKHQISSLKKGELSFQKGIFQITKEVRIVETREIKKIERFVKLGTV